MSEERESFVRVVECEKDDGCQVGRLETRARTVVVCLF